MKQHKRYKATVSVQLLSWSKPWDASCPGTGSDWTLKPVQEHHRTAVSGSRVPSDWPWADQGPWCETQSGVGAASMQWLTNLKSACDSTDVMSGSRVGGGAWRLCSLSCVKDLAAAERGNAISTALDGGVSVRSCNNISPSVQTLFPVDRYIFTHDAHLHWHGGAYGLQNQIAWSVTAGEKSWIWNQSQQTWAGPSRDTSRHSHLVSVWSTTGSRLFDKVPGENLQTLNKRDHCLALGLELLTFLQ